MFSPQTPLTLCISIEYPAHNAWMDFDQPLQALQSIEAWLESSNSRKSKKALRSIEDALKHLRTNDSPIAKCEDFCHSCYHNQSRWACNRSLAFKLTSIAEDVEYVQRKLSKKLRRTRLLRNIADRGCQILKAGLGALKIASSVTAVVPSAELVACVFALVAAGEVALHLLQKCGRSLSCEEENLTELVRSVICVQHFLREIVYN